MRLREGLVATEIGALDETAVSLHEDERIEAYLVRPSDLYLPAFQY